MVNAVFFEKNELIKFQKFNRYYTNYNEIRRSPKDIILILKIFQHPSWWNAGVLVTLLLH